MPYIYTCTCYVGHGYSLISVCMYMPSKIMHSLSFALDCDPRSYSPFLNVDVLIFWHDVYEFPTIINVDNVLFSWGELLDFFNIKNELHIHI